MYSWMVRQILRLLYGKVTKGELRLPTLGLAADASLVFPGDSSFGGEHRGKAAIRAWMQRFASLQPQLLVHDAGAAGPPWNMRVFMRFSDRIVAPNGYVYENEGMEYIRLRWGLIHEIRVHLDTEKVTALDTRLLAGAEQTVSAPAGSAAAGVR